MEKKRDVYYDVLRGIAILMVIAIHAYPQDATSLELFVRQSLNCAVPIFLAVSGYFVGQIKFENEGVYLSFIKKQLIRVYIPMLIWSLPWLVLNIRNGQGIGTQFLMTLLGGMSIFYFIPLIIQCYILTPVLKNINKLGGGVSLAITIIGIMIFTYIQHIACMNVHILFSGSPFFLWLIFYTLGIMKAQNRIWNLNLKWIVCGILISFLLSYWESNILSQFGHIVHGIKPTSHLYSFFILLLLFSEEIRTFVAEIERTSIVKFLSWIGRISYFIYLTHTLMLFVLRHYISEWNWSLLVIVGTAFSIGFVLLVQKTVPVRYQLYLGLK